MRHYSMEGVTMTFFAHETSVDTPIAVEMRAETMASVAGDALGKGRFKSKPGKTHTITEFLDYYSVTDVDASEFDLDAAAKGCRTKKEYFPPPDIMVSRCRLNTSG